MKAQEILTTDNEQFPSGIRVYYHPTVETDLSVHIQWETEG
jgi:hypothetical protein